MGEKQELRPEDIRAEAFTDGRTNFSLRVTHIPTGIVAVSEDPDRSVARTAALAELRRALDAVNRK